jgi:hypothetical protein
MLSDVPIWFEIWRKLNGFPASIYQESEDPMSGSIPAKSVQSYQDAKAGDDEEK